MMTGAGTFAMISRVVVARRHGGLLCAVGTMSSLFSLFLVTSLGELSSEQREQ